MRRVFSLLVAAFALSACGAMGEYFPDFDASNSSNMSSASTTMGTPSMPNAPQATGFLRPEVLVECRGHVLVPAMGMTFVPSGGQPPSRGQYLREENLTPPYRVFPPGAAGTMDFVPSRLNVDLDGENRIINLRCG